ncbi:sensor histidine kinase [Paenibacillus algorifonticola]|uniref:sensor histidine kinase n=1 Tax=Paenibacillus algorifonticola TaxID=684063 RepID=UPI003D285836
MRTIDFSLRQSILRRSKLSTLMVACFVLLNLLFLLVIIWLSYRSFSDVTFSEISKARLALLNESTNRGFDFMTDMTNTAYSVVSNKDVKEMLEAGAISKYDMLVKRRAISDLLHHTLVVNSGISSIEIYTDKFNDVPYSSTDLVFPVSKIADQNWFSALEKADAIWIPEEENASSKSLIGYAQHMFDSKGRTMGYLIISMSQQDVLRNFADVPMVLEGQVLVVDTAGNIIVKVNDSQVKGEEVILDAEWLGDRSKTLSDGYELLRRDDQSYLVVFSKPSSVQWRLVQTIPTRTLLKATYQAGWYVLGIGILSLLLSAILTYWFVKSIIKPLRRLMAEMKRLERGDFHAKATSAFTEEYVQLSYSFNHMVSRLKESMDDVKTESKAKRDAQTSLLEAQIKPHFLYNTLDMIHWRALDYKAEDISFMITQLGKLLRIGLSGGKLFIRVRDELEHARCYLSIQKERMTFPIAYTEQIMDPQIRGYYIPKIILQPLIENAVIHGSPADSSSELALALDIREQHVPGQAPYLEISLTDNGRGLPEDWHMDKATGIGIRNVHTRLQLYCGPWYGLQLANSEQGGVKVTVKLPIIETEAQLKRLLDGEKG